MKQNPTSADVARLAGVSQSAVSRTFTPGASISEATREKVLQAAATLGYRPNALARAVISGKSNLIAILMAYLDNHFYPIVLEQLSRRLQAEGYQTLLMMTEPGRQDELVQRMLQYQVEGIVMASATLSSRLASECMETGIPVVTFNRYVASLPASSVTSDNLEGGRLVADFLVRGGHERIAFIAGKENSSTNRDREAGFHQGLSQHGRTAHARAVGAYIFEGAANAARSLMTGPAPPDAIFVANDHMAIAAIDVIRTELGLSIPGDVSIVGYDDVPEAAWQGYSLTTMAQPSSAMVDATASILLEQIRSSTVRKRAWVVPARMVVRDSARLPVEPASD